MGSSSTLTLPWGWKLGAGARSLGRKLDQNQGERCGAEVNRSTNFEAGSGWWRTEKWTVETGITSGVVSQIAMMVKIAED